MPAMLRHAFVSIRELVLTAGPFVALAIVLLALAYWLLDPTPPRRVVLATGVEQGAYHEFGKRYAQMLSGHGIRVELRLTQGSAENLALLRAGQVDLAFVQGGADDTAARGDEPIDEHLVSLGSLFYEPIWLFYRADAAQRLMKADRLERLADLPGWRLNVGTPGSGSPNLMGKLFEANRIDAKTLTLLQEPPTPAVVALLGGEADALVFNAAPEALLVQMLLQTPGIRLFDFAQADAYSRRFGFMSPVRLPRGVVDLARDLPPQDVRLVAPTAALVARDTLHPALMQLFVQAARQIHGESGWFQRKGDFPSADNLEWPIAKEAERFYRAGPPFLQRYLPFWLANLVDRMWLALLSIVAILIPLSRIVPPLYQFRIRSRIFRWYGELRAIESSLGQRPTAELAADLDRIEQRVEGVTVPLSYADELYALRSHIQMVRGRIAA
jgi:TRAP transporter TAXI family solute receptor